MLYFLRFNLIHVLFQENKVSLAATIAQQYGIEVDVASIFDVHVKRIHEYKRQLLNIMHVITMYNSKYISTCLIIVGGMGSPVLCNG